MESLIASTRARPGGLKAMASAKRPVACDESNPVKIYNTDQDILMSTVIDYNILSSLSK
jgi:hypothetical protein